MTRKDFEFIARMLATVRPDTRAHSTQEFVALFGQWNLTVDQFANELASTNPRFDADRFRDACNR